MTRCVRLEPKKKPPPWEKMRRGGEPPPAGKIKSPSQGPQFTRSIWTFSATGKWLATSSTHARITAGVAFAGTGFWALISRIAASCCFDIFCSPSARSEVANPIGYRSPDLGARIFLNEVHAGNGDFGLVRPSPAEVA